MAAWSLSSYKKRVKWLVIFICLGCFFYFSMLRSGLPSDEEMIRHFTTHRPHIEELVRRYRSFTPLDGGSHHAWKNVGDTSKLMRKSGVQDIDFNADAVWLPNPYSIETGVEIYNKILKRENNYIQQQHGELSIVLRPMERYRSINLRHSVVWKRIVFFPIEPKIEGGKLIGPTLWDGEPAFTERVENSLNMLPWRWREYGCAYRKVEANWFLKICNGH